MQQDPAALRAHLQGEMGVITWPELQTHFARGALLAVTDSLDLLDVAMALVRDDRDTVEDWLRSGTLRQPGIEHARDWETRRPRFQAVVVAPWVLVKESAH
ncbi:MULTISPECIES: DUF2288 domain-containing protein [Ectothiorhodospira]|uniref:DUF2288 domain-containing protein n=1 Tax=Ectothiorhodospira TaxID=1051 RepID=UPI00024A83C5|nr:MULTISPECIES: DUF2288 domain-containing protein [Ectothiorhodospira]EHQ53336.1 hypothetical protein ECTPHS_11672 [Ectothiorhodospira sp. PHS-1]MCG5513123.1 DUF2288 domain-containing protein [Ectothiorhodospira shaposhnikovii]